ncbi:unnamed protein product [Lactuca saligna]|uniref:Uncharacterized protein n=1 Tax=Lactuca saligna TaxID=75948 RepID=A0AA35YR23_LACSI|nr:unnamed protein product [Lactuca saligna]
MTTVVDLRWETGDHCIFGGDDENRIRLLGCSNLDRYSPSISFFHHRCSPESEESCSGRQISRKSYSSRSEEETLSYNNRYNHRSFVSDHDQRRHRYVDGDYDRDYRRTSSQPIHHGLDNRNKAADDVREFFVMILSLIS